MGLLATAAKTAVYLQRPISGEGRCGNRHVASPGIVDVHRRTSQTRNSRTSGEETRLEFGRGNLRRQGRRPPCVASPRFNTYLRRHPWAAPGLRALRASGQPARVNLLGSACWGEGLLDDVLAGSGRSRSEICRGHLGLPMAPGPLWTTASNLLSFGLSAYIQSIAHRFRSSLHPPRTRQLACRAC